MEQVRFEYSEELENELNLILAEYRNGLISVKQMLKLIDISCKEHLENKENNFVQRNSQT
jgi:hypothetical protein